MPMLSAEESAEETTSLCLKLFKCIGAKDISALDIDIAHRVPPRKPSNRPNPIVCRFVQRLARNEVLACRKSSKNVTATQLGFDPSICTEDLAIFEHLSPQQQNLLFKAKKIKDTANFKFCWVKGGTILLRKTDESVIHKIKREEDLLKLNSFLSSPA